jgi:hypothetical protein
VYFLFFLKRNEQTAKESEEDEPLHGCALYRLKNYRASKVT